MIYCRLLGSKPITWQDDDSLDFLFVCPHFDHLRSTWILNPAYKDPNVSCHVLAAFMGQTLELTRTFIKASERFLYKAPEPAAPEEDNQPAEA